MSSASHIWHKDSSLAAMTSPKLAEPSVTTETNNIYIWVMAKIESSNTAFCQEELKEESVMSILMTSLKQHTDFLRISEVIITHNILTTQKQDPNKKSGKKP
eukprot:13503345-Ditylum_brightwellii.AAC.1